MELEIVYLSPHELTPYENNTRKHNPGDIDGIKKSIQDVGFRDPIGIWGKNNLIVEGHGRQLAAIELGMEKVPCIRLDDMTEEQRKEYAIRHNRSAEMSEWDFGKLEEELAALDIAGIDMSDLKFDLDALNGGGIAEFDIREDEVPEAPEEPKSKRGDIYQLGRHRLMCGDSTSRDDVGVLMGGKRADMVFTDPPYNIAGESKNFTATINSPHMRELAKTEWDKGFDIKALFPVLFDAMGEDVSVYICTSHFLAGHIWDWMKQWANHWSYCIWSKPNPMPSLSKRHWTWNTEIVCYATRGKHTFNFPEEGHALSTWTINKISGDTGHPTEKPVAVPAMAVSHSSKDDDVILDLFGGSGSTLIACEQLKRTCYMMELDPHYVDVIIQRWENLTGEKAVLLNG